MSQVAIGRINDGVVSIALFVEVGIASSSEIITRLNDVVAFAAFNDVVMINRQENRVVACSPVVNPHLRIKVSLFPFRAVCETNGLQAQPDFIGSLCKLPVDRDRF